MRTPSTALLRAAIAAAAVVPALVLVPAPTAAAAPGDTVTAPLSQLISQLPVQDEDRTGYDRDAFKHWVDADRDGCNARAETLLEEAVVAPEVTGRCSITPNTGEWLSWYDEVTVTSAGSLDIDHMVPLAEAWDSGASEWTATEREEYANDLGDERSLVAVTARSNRSKGDKDPAEWLPPADSATCRYVTDWVTIKTRWDLAIDNTELTAINETAAGCEDQAVTVELAR
ncbi:Protein of unknown function [Streptomyces zhaozhouensis]|uniref:GmrSD restriction endonucleases C-terminal domain-containing protein n=1 Tax=Streptomyces zhaozhouensis TaxID=1300267 RepID=A0A286E7R6_9ACTN|nr:HNH endonuclease family protein [Streptomyces zhaozhouensis]SOD66936.1 Protein of unknown function [Streptomyces zhaozhouensis]